MLKTTLILSVLVALPAAAETLTLGQAVQKALEGNRSVVRAQADIGVAGAQRRLALSAILPHADLDSTATHHKEEISFNSLTIQPRSDWSSRLTITQPLYAGGREFKAIKQRGLAIESARAGARSTEEAVIYRTASDYLAAVEAQALIDVEKQNVKIAAERRRQATELLRVGEVTKVDVLRAEASQKAAERQLAAAEQRLHAAKSQLKLDMASSDEIEVAAPELTLPQLPSSTELAERANVMHPDLEQATTSLQIAKLEVRKQHAGWLPTVSLKATMSRQKSLDSAGDVGISIRLPIFNAGEITSRTAIAREQEKQALALADETRQSVREDIDRAVVALETARKSHDLAREQLTAAEGEYAQISALYRAQEATSLDIDAAENSLANARRIVVTESMQKQLAELRVWYAAGSLKPILLEKEH